MGAGQKLVHEVKSVALATIFFAVWIGALVLLKRLVLAEYEIEFYGFSAALVGVLVLAKVVVVLERVPLGGWVRRSPAWVDVFLRTALYAAGVVVVLAIEHGVRGRGEHGGFTGAVRAAFAEVNAPHLWANVLCVSGALLVYNALAVVRLHLGGRSLLGLFLAPIPERAPAHAHAADAHPPA